MIYFKCDIMKRRILILSTFILFILFLMLYLFNRVNLLDTFIYDLIISFKSNWFTKFMKYITFLASTKFITCIVILLFILSLFKGKLPLIINWIILGEVVINNIIKVLVRRERPIIINMVTENTFSFPSGHTMAAVVFYGFLIYLIRKSKLDKKYKILVSIILSLLIILIMMSRIYLGAHYFSDVIAGASLATSYLLLMVGILERRNVL